MYFLRLLAVCWPGEQVDNTYDRKNEETRLDASDMKGPRKLLRVSWTAKKTNKWVLNEAGEKRELLDTVKARKLACYGHIMRKQGSCLEKDSVMQGTMPGVLALSSASLSQ